MTQINGLALLAVSIAVEFLTHLMRALVFYAVLHNGLGWLPTVNNVDWIVLAWPVLAAGATLFGWPGGSVMRWEIGARKPSQRERAVMAETCERLAEKGARLPRRWYVIDAPLANASALGSTLYVTRELLVSPYLEGVVAHELGHTNTLDGRLTLALERVAFPGLAWTVRWLESRERFLAAVLLQVTLAGGYGQKIWPLSALWRWYWRRREFAADRVASRLGAGGELVEYLEGVPLALDAASPFMRGMTHPYVEQRVDRLERLAA